VVLFITLYKVVPTFESLDGILKCDHFNIKATEQYFPVVLFITLYKVVPTSESVDKMLRCGHSNESYWAVLSFVAVYLAIQGETFESGSNVCGIVC